MDMLFDMVLKEGFGEQFFNEENLKILKEDFYNFSNAIDAAKVEFGMTEEEAAEYVGKHWTPPTLSE